MIPRKSNAEKEKQKSPREWDKSGINWVGGIVLSAYRWASLHFIKSGHQSVQNEVLQCALLELESKLEWFQSPCFFHGK